MASFDYDVAVIGSGVGSLAALCAAEKGYLRRRTELLSV
jgi:phytoene dehydrogenase-like protein